MFALTDFAHWVVINRDSLIVSGYAPQILTLLQSDVSSSSYDVLYYNREEVAEDPWISNQDHFYLDTWDGADLEEHSMLYGEAYYGGWLYWLVNHGGANVWLSDDDKSFCGEYDACTAFPCLAGQTCTDIIGGSFDAAGRTCVVVEYNACTAFPCLANQICTDIIGGSSNAAGRTCAYDLALCKGHLCPSGTHCAPGPSNAKSQGRQCVKDPSNAVTFGVAGGVVGLAGVGTALFGKWYINRRKMAMEAKAKSAVATDGSNRGSISMSTCSVSTASISTAESKV